MTTCPYGIHPDERFLAELRDRQRTPAGRAKLRERVAVEHTLAHGGRWQGRRARYRSRRKNLFDLRRCAVVDILDVLSHLPMHAEKVALLYRRFRASVEECQEMLPVGVAGQPNVPPARRPA